MAEPENQSATAVAFKVSISSDGTKVTLNWPRLKAAQAVTVSRNGEIIANLPGAQVSYVDPDGTGVDVYVVTVATASRSATGVIDVLPAVPATPTLVTTPNTTAVVLGSAPTTLQDAAVLANGANPTGSITFTLLNGSTTVHSETVTVNGNGTYRTSAGYVVT